MQGPVVKISNKQYLCDWLEYPTNGGFKVSSKTQIYTTKEATV